MFKNSHKPGKSIDGFVPRRTQGRQVGFGDSTANRIRSSNFDSILPPVRTRRPGYRGNPSVGSSMSGFTSRSTSGHSNNPSLSSEPQASLLNTTLPGQSLQRPADSEGREKPKRKLLRFWKRKHKWSLKRRLMTTGAVILLLAVGFGGWDAWQLYHKLHHLAVGNLTASVGGAENILVAGSTNRCNLKVQNAEWGFCSQGVTGVNSDIIFIIHIVPKKHTVSILSIPRDTFVPNARSGGQAFKIDAALYQGPTQLVNAVEEDFGIPIQHYVEVGFDGFVNIVNAVGGIKMDFPMPVYDAESYLNIQTPGCTLLNGVKALQVVRARHLQYKPASVTTNDVAYWPQEVESDIARIARTHEFLRVLASTVAQKGLSNPVTDQKLVDALAPQVQVDSGFSTATMVALMQEFHAVNLNTSPQYTLPIATTNFGDYIYNGNDYGDVVFPVEANDQKVINEFLGSSNSTNTMNGKALPSRNSVTVNVVNGSGVSDQAGQITAALQSLGFSTVGQPGTVNPASSEAQETVVYYASKSKEADAETVARQLTGYVILSQNASMVTNDSDVTVVTGTGLNVKPPQAKAGTSSSASSSSPSSSSTTPAPAAASSTQTAIAEASSALATPSSATQGLSPWDPRACTQ